MRRPVQFLILGLLVFSPPIFNPAMAETAVPVPQSVRPVTQTAQKVTCYLPIRDNQGKDYAASVFESAEKVFLEIAGGFTMTGLVRGAYRSREKDAVYHDTSREYFMIVDSANQLERLQKALSNLTAAMAQEVLFCEVTRPEVLWISPENRASNTPTQNGFSPAK